MIKGYLTTQEAAEKLGVSGGRIRQLVAEKRLNAVKVGQTNLIKESALKLAQDRKRAGRPRKETRQ
ncbi:MAG: excisionase family DNA-binding protein [Pyrinomonadaceae bacterium]